MLIYTSKAPGWGKQKPKQWGPLSAVRSAVFAQAERLGIDPKSIVGLWPMWEGADETVRDIINGMDGAKESGASWQKNGILFDGASRVLVGNYDRLKFTTEMTAISIYNDLNGANFDYLLGKINSAWTYGINISNSAQQVQWSINNNRLSFPEDSVVGGLDHLTDKDVLVVATYDGATRRLHVDGGYSSGSYSTPITANNDPFSIGSRGGSSNRFSGPILFTALINKAIPTDSCLLLNETPYALLQPVPQTYYFDMGGGGTPTGSATVSGSAAVASAGYKRSSTTATVTGTASITGSGSKSANAAATVTGSASVTASGVKSARAHALTTGTASATAAGYKSASSTATVTGAASITAVGSAIIPTPTGQATVTGSASIISSGYKSATTTATVTGTSSITATGYKASAIPTGSATVTGNAVITSIGYKIAKAHASTTGTGSITSLGSKRATGQASVTGSASVTAIGSAVVNIPTGQATVSGSAAITSIGYKRAVVNSEVRGDPAITSTGYKITTISALVAGSASIIVAGYNPSSAIKVLQMSFAAHQADIKFTAHQGNITFKRIGA